MRAEGTEHQKSRHNGFISATSSSAPGPRRQVSSGAYGRRVASKGPAPKKDSKFVISPTQKPRGYIPKGSLPPGEKQHHEPRKEDHEKNHELMENQDDEGQLAKVASAPAIISSKSSKKDKAAKEASNTTSNETMTTSKPPVTTAELSSPSEPKRSSVSEGTEAVAPPSADLKHELLFSPPSPIVPADRDKDKQPEKREKRTKKKEKEGKEKTKAQEEEKASRERDRGNGKGSKKDLLANESKIIKEDEAKEGETKGAKEDSEKVIHRPNKAASKEGTEGEQEKGENEEKPKEELKEDKTKASDRKILHEAIAKHGEKQGEKVDFTENGESKIGKSKKPKKDQDTIKTAEKKQTEKGEKDFKKDVQKDLISDLSPKNSTKTIARHHHAKVKDKEKHRRKSTGKPSDIPRNKSETDKDEPEHKQDAHKHVENFFENTASNTETNKKEVAKEKKRSPKKHRSKSTKEISKDKIANSDTTRGDKGKPKEKGKEQKQKPNDERNKAIPTMTSKNIDMDRTPTKTKSGIWMRTRTSFRGTGQRAHSLSPTNSGLKSRAHSRRSISSSPSRNSRSLSFTLPPSPIKRRKNGRKKDSCGSLSAANDSSILPVKQERKTN